MLGRRATGLVGPSGSPIGSSEPAWTRLLADYAMAFPKIPFLGFAPSYFDTMEPALAASRPSAATSPTAVGGIAPRSPASSSTCRRVTSGSTRHRQAIAPNYLVAGRPQAGPRSATIRTVGPVDDSYGGRFGPGKPLPSRTSARRAVKRQPAALGPLISP